MLSVWQRVKMKSSLRNHYKMKSKRRKRTDIFQKVTFFGRQFQADISGRIKKVHSERFLKESFPKSIFEVSLSRSCSLSVFVFVHPPHIICPKEPAEESELVRLKSLDQNQAKVFHLSFRMTEPWSQSTNPYSRSIVLATWRVTFVPRSQIRSCWRWQRVISLFYFFHWCFLTKTILFWYTIWV